MDTLDDETGDGYRWLEELDSPAATAWVRQRNQETLATLTAGTRYGQLRDEIRQVLDATDRIPVPNWCGRHLYNFWRDRAHPRGLWRRTTFDGYRQEEPEWELLLDLDELADREEENWVWRAAALLRPDHRRALLSLSRDGADAVLVREYDLVTRSFVTDGFTLPEAKSDVCWIDIDHIFVTTDFGPGSLTRSGYPRVAKRWRRGTPLAEAETVFEGRETDVLVYAVHHPTPGFERDLVGRRIDFFSGEHHLLGPGDALTHIPVPTDAEYDSHREWLLIQPRSAWTVGGTEYPAGSLLATDLIGFVAGAAQAAGDGGRDRTGSDRPAGGPAVPPDDTTADETRPGPARLHVLFTPDERTALAGYRWTRDHLILAVLDDACSRLVACTPHGNGWRRQSLAGLSSHLTADQARAGTAPTGRAGAGHRDYASIDIVDTDPEHSDGYLHLRTGFLEPSTLALGRVGAATEILKREPAFFDHAAHTVRQFFATSADGTEVPYFVVGPADDTPGPALLTGYGGFEIPLTPQYSGIIGRGWLARGGRYVVANIRGGGEYGPRWHHAALRERRPRTYEDFAAVAGDLVRRGLTEPDRLGIWGGSNGGLLMGVMLTCHPQLFGAVVAHVPLLDMRRYHRLLAGASWMAEYGDPDNPDDWAFLRTYSPYHNIRPGQPYPPVLLLTSTRDDRVHPGHARKMAARLRAYGYDVAYHENVEGGHGGAANNEQSAVKWALTLEFLWSRLAGAAR